MSIHTEVGNARVRSLCMTPTAHMAAKETVPANAVETTTQVAAEDEVVEVARPKRTRCKLEAPVELEEMVGTAAIDTRP